ncbi:hypothetical protein KAU11_07380 [Candidatus Babeliales bacterium]|nr:hypothetical protein [Candidatus Babeliales bacterium]
MGIKVQSTTSLDYASRTTTSLTKPSGTVDGDLLVAVFAHNDDKTISTVPTGWTQQGTTANAISGINTYIYYKVAASEPSSWDWVLNASTFTAGVVLRVDGQKSTGYSDQFAGATVTNDDTPTYTNTITPTSALALIIFVITGDGDNNSSASGYAVVTDDPTWTERADMNGNGRLMAVATAIRTATSATGDSSATLSGTTANVIDTTGIISSFLRDPDEDMTHPILAMNSSSIIAPTITVSTTSSNTILVMNPSTAIDSSATAIDPTWTDETKTDTTWTDQTK